jgi:hypothetical protein
VERGADRPACQNIANSSNSPVRALCARRPPTITECPAPRILEHRPDGVLAVRRGRTVFVIAPDGPSPWQHVPIRTW